MSRMPRREFLGLSALAAGSALLTTRVAFAYPGGRRRRFVLVIMRGALDGLAAVPACGDPAYAGLRREFALAAPGRPPQQIAHAMTGEFASGRQDARFTGGPGEPPRKIAPAVTGEFASAHQDARFPGDPGGARAALPLDGFFGLHPSLGFLQQSYAARELIVFHALASPYRERSHFDGQDVLENGTPKAHALQSGWLNRALAAAPGPSGREAGVALGQNVPLVMRGPAAVASWSPSRLAALDEDTYARITDLYARDPLLSRRLADAMAADAMAAGDADPGGMGDNKVDGNRGGDAGSGRASGATQQVAGGGAGRYAEIVQAAAGFLRQDEGPRVAVFDTTGWDTHANEGGAEGQLAGRLRQLDAGLAILRQQLQSAWSDTAVLLVTEFGRTAAINGTRGTDHGTGTVALLVGGAVAGGRVIADWPGLGPQALYQGRDLAPTLDLRSVIKGLLAEQLEIPPRTLATDVFPDSAGVKPLSGLVRG